MAKISLRRFLRCLRQKSSTANLGNVPSVTHPHPHPAHTLKRDLSSATDGTKVSHFSTQSPVEHLGAQAEIYCDDLVAPDISDPVQAPDRDRSVDREHGHPPQPELTNAATNARPSPDEKSERAYVRRDVSVVGNDNKVIYNANFGQDISILLTETIRGAEFDSSARNPPPKCHPETRLRIIERCLEFIVTCSGEKQFIWIVGMAGVGKSAIMQFIAEHIPIDLVTLGASVFHSTNGRNDGTKTITTIAYQLAVKFKRYRAFVLDEVQHDPTLLQKSTSTQFNKFIVEPFIHRHLLDGVGRILIMIDGIDECADRDIQEQLLRLICGFCIQYPSSSIVWIIASRPERHITTLLRQPEFQRAFEEEEISVDSDEGCKDVEKFLREELARIKKTSFSLDSDSLWPLDSDIQKLVQASGGLFVYARTAINYIDESGAPAPRLSLVLRVIEGRSMSIKGKHPLAQLHALYARIVSKDSNGDQGDPGGTLKLWLVLVAGLGGVLRPWERNLIVLCNWFAMTPDFVYDATDHLHSVLKVPMRNEVHEKGLSPIHKSFLDYITDSAGSAISANIKEKARELQIERTLRTLEEAPDGIDFGDTTYKLGDYGVLARGPGTGYDISLTWSMADSDDWGDNETRLSVYKLAVENVVDGIRNGERALQSVFCIRLLKTRFKKYGARFPSDELRDIVFDESRREEFMEHEILKQEHDQTFHLSDIKGNVKVRFRCCASETANSNDRWDASCKHERRGEWGEDRDQDWTTEYMLGEDSSCESCRRRLESHLEARSRDSPVTVMYTSTGRRWIEFQFVDPGDDLRIQDGAKWTYWFSFDKGCRD